MRPGSRPRCGVGRSAPALGWGAAIGAARGGAGRRADAAPARPLFRDRDARLRRDGAAAVRAVPLSGRRSTASRSARTAPTASAASATSSRTTSARCSSSSLIYGLLAAALAGFMLLERSRLGVAFRMIGEDATLAALNGIAVARVKVLAAGLAGALAGLGGGLYAHLTTYRRAAHLRRDARRAQPRLRADRRARHRVRPAARRADRHRPAGIDQGVRRLSHDHLRRPGRACC